MGLIHSMDTDPSKWVVNTVVAFVPHERAFPETKLLDGTPVPAKTIKVSEAQLRAEADKANARIRTTGRLDTLTIGHRNFDPGFKETDQPPLVGFCRNYRAQWVEREGGKFLALVYDEYAARDRAGEHDLYRQYPFRSAEYHPGLGIAGVAALVRPPALDMGTTYIYEARPMPEAAMGPTNAAPPGDDQWTDEDAKTYAAFCKMMKKYTTDKGVVNYAAPVAPTPAAPVIPASYAADLAALRQKLEASEAARVQAECRAMLDPFRTSLKFDYDRELAALQACPTPEGRVAHVKYMADFYQVLPTGGMVQVYAGPVVPAGNPGPAAAPSNYQAVLSHMNARPGTTYDQAEAAVAAK